MSKKRKNAQIVDRQHSDALDLSKTSQGTKRKHDDAGPVADNSVSQKKAKKQADISRKGAGKLTKFDGDSDNDAPIKAQVVAETNAAKKPTRRQSEQTSELPTRSAKSHPKSKEAPKRERLQKARNPERDHVPENLSDFKKFGAPSGHLLKRRDALLPGRKNLPIWPQADKIRASLRENNVLVLTGETGSGKSTQVPQFLLSEPWCTKCIAITQPRRVAAISLARRVAEEMGSLMGGQSPAARVGYSVRFDNATGPNTRVKFLTEGMLLQEMLRDSNLEQYSAIVVDEVHERSVNVDLILGFLNELITRGQGKRKHPLKVVIMSATADVESLVKFFEESRPLDGNESESVEGKERKSSTKTVSSSAANLDSSTAISTCFVEGRQFPVKTTYLPSPTQDWVESALKLIFQIHYKEPLPGDILVFLTGQDTIESLEKLVNDYAEGMDKDVPKLLALPLFAALPQHAQQRIFEPTPLRTRKVILATNIAETSVTVPGVRFVIDCGKSKIKQFRNRLGLESLLVKPISRSAAIQRKGRAGREAPGQCYRLYTEEGYNEMEERTTPEILRCDLSQAILTMKARGVDDVLNFPFLDRPPREALEKALLQLLHLGALTETGSITESGLRIAKFPLTPTLGRVLVEAAEQDCLVDVIDIISALSVENIFLNLVTEERKEEAEEARRELFKREGDHMTLLVTVQRYAEERADRKLWCQKHFVSHRAMQNVMNVRKQLREQCKKLSLLISEESPSSSEEHTKAILNCLLKGFISNTARLMPDSSYRTLMGNQTVSIHPSSVLFGRKTEGIVFTEFVFTGKAWARGVSAVQLDWVSQVIESIM